MSCLDLDCSFFLTCIYSCNEWALVSHSFRYLLDLLMSWVSVYLYNLDAIC